MTHSFDGLRRVQPSLPAAELLDDQESTHQNAGFLSSILDNAPDPIIASDLDGCVTFANAAAAELLGQPVDALVGRPVLDCLPWHADLSTLLNGRHERDLSEHDLEIPSARGERWSAVTSRRLRLSTGEVVGHVLLLRDVGERRRAERALAAKNEELESYVSHVSHDLRSPLVSVLGFARLVRRDYGSLLDTDGHRFLDRIVQAGQTMESMIEDLLEVSRIGCVDEPNTLIDPLGVIHQVITDQKHLIDKCDVQIGLPTQPSMLWCSRTRVYQIFSNLIGNALAHMGPVEAARVEVSIDDELDLHHIRVADNGKGVAPEHHEKIFEVFSTLGGRTDGRKATGVGLAIVRKIAIQHGGGAWVESPADGGTIFHVTLRAS